MAKNGALFYQIFIYSTTPITSDAFELNSVGISKVVAELSVA